MERESDCADDEKGFRELTRRPPVAWPTVCLLVGCVTTFAASTGLYLAGVLPLGLSICVNAVASYAAFTVGHDASHNALSANRRFNDWCGRLSTVLLSPIPFFRMFRYIHMQHHRFTNEPGKDPDFYCGRGSAWTLPLRWMTLDLHYFTIYLRPSVFRQRPRSEQREFLLAALFAVAMITGVLAQGWGREFVLLYLLPTRMAIAFLALTFDFLPHYPHQARGVDEPYLATSNRVGCEWLLTPILFSQNYHLVHHLYPTVPFYRYRAVWRAREGFHRSRNPAAVRAFRLRPEAAGASPAPAGQQP